MGRENQESDPASALGSDENPLPGNSVVEELETRDGFTDPSGVRHTARLAEIQEVGGVTYEQAADPTAPEPGDTWYDTENGVLLIYSAGGWRSSDGYTLTNELLSFQEPTAEFSFNDSTRTLAPDKTATVDETWENYFDSPEVGLEFVPKNELNRVIAELPINLSNARPSELYLRESDGTLIASKSGVDISVKNRVGFSDVTLNAGEAYTITVDDGGSNFRYPRSDSASFPYTSDALDITGGVSSGSVNTNYAYMFDTLSSQISGVAIAEGGSSDNPQPANTVSRPDDQNASGENSPFGVEVRADTSLVGIRAEISSNTDGLTTAYLTNGSRVVAETDVSSLSAGDRFEMIADLPTGNYALTGDAGGSGYTRGDVSDGGNGNDDLTIVSGVFGKFGVGDNGSRLYNFNNITPLLPGPASDGSVIIAPNDQRAVRAFESLNYQIAPESEQISVDAGEMRDFLSPVTGFESGNITPPSENWSSWEGDVSSFTAQQNTVITGDFTGELVSNGEVATVTTTRDEARQFDRIEYSVRIGSDVGAVDEVSQIFEFSEQELFRIEFNDENNDILSAGEVTLSNPGSQTITGSWEPGVTYDVVVELDYENNNVAVDVNGAGASVDQQLEAVDTIRFENETDDSGTARSVYIDDITFTETRGVFTPIESDVGRVGRITSLPVSDRAAFRVAFLREDLLNRPSIGYFAWRVVR